MINTNFVFLKSALQLDGNFISIDDTILWLKTQNKSVNVNITKSNLSSLSNWLVEDYKKSIIHKSGKFFSIEGVNVKTNWGDVSEWTQPIINQPEIGYLGFLTKEINGILHFLVQAKIEPGNINNVQLSPTLQATRSNYTQVHKGIKPKYLEYFQNAKSQQILLDQLQSEQGARFLKKRNRNIIVKVDEDIPIYDNFIWLTLGQIKKMINYDNLVNMDTRTVIAGIPFGTQENAVIDYGEYKKNMLVVENSFLKSALLNSNSLHSIEEVITFLTQIKSTYDLKVTKISLDDLDNWIFNDSEIYHVEKKYFKIIGVDVEIENREVVKWSQPMIEPAQNGLCAFVCKEINGVLHFAVQAKLECGNLDIIELAPTVQCLTGNYKNTKKDLLPFLDYVLNVEQNKIVYNTLQSEEGGRFYKEQNRNMIVIAGDEIPIELPENYIWMTLNQLYTFLKFNNYLNIQTRSLISAVTFI